MAEMSADFRQGFILGMAMQPLCVLTNPAPTPVIDISFNGHMKNFGTDSSVTASYRGETPIYTDGYGGAKCWSATTYTLVTLNNCAKYLGGSFTILFRFKLNSTGMAPFYGLRRMVWFNYLENDTTLFVGTEIGFAGTVSTAAKTTNKVNFELQTYTSLYGATNRADGNWHTAILRRDGTSVSLQVDDEVLSGSYPVTTPKDQIKLSGTNNVEVDANGFAVNGADFDTEGLTLNGYIQGLKVFDKVLSDYEIALINLADSI